MLIWILYSFSCMFNYIIYTQYWDSSAEEGYSMNLEAFMNVFFHLDFCS